MLNDIDDFFLQKEEPTKSCLLFLRAHILGFSPHITEVWRYKMPFYCYKGKRFGYLWFHKKKLVPYIGIVEGKKVEHPELIMEERSKMKIMLINPRRDIAVMSIDMLLKMAIDSVKQ